MREINEKFVSVKMPKLSLRACLHGGGAPQQRSDEDLQCAVETS